MWWDEGFAPSEDRCPKAGPYDMRFYNRIVWWLQDTPPFGWSLLKQPSLLGFPHSLWQSVSSSPSDAASSSPCSSLLLSAPLPFPIGVRHGVSKGVTDSLRPPALRAGHPWNSRQAISWVARPAGRRRVRHDTRGVAWNLTESMATPSHTPHLPDH
jgi:hypothetical protein